MDQPQPAGRKFLRFVPPVLIVAVTAAASAAFERLPGTDVEGMYRVSSAVLVWMVGGLLLSGWLLFFSGLRLLYKLLILAAVLAAGYGSVKQTGFTGDMQPTFRFRWEKSPEQSVEEHRAAQTGSAGAVSLTPEQPDDSPAYRGRERDGGVTVTGFRRDWDVRPPKLLWKQPVGGGYAGFAVANGHAVTVEQRRADEVVACYEVATGREVWAYAYPAAFNEALGGPGPRTTPTISAGDVFSLGATGKLVCLNGSTGKPRWETLILADNDNLQWGMSGSPLVYDDVVVVNPGAQRESAKGRALVAYDRASGKELWRSGNERTAYASPMLATLGGVRQILLFDAAGLGGHDAATGKELWRFPWVTQGPQGINVAQPVVLDGERVFIASGYGEGGALVKVTKKDDAWSAEQVYRTKRTVMRSKFASPVESEGHVYGLNDGILECVGVKTGASKWKDDRRAGRGRAYGHGQLLLVTDPEKEGAGRRTLLVLTESGELVLADPTPAGFREWGRFAALEGDKTWNNPAVAGGKLLVRNAREMACFDLRE